VLNKTPADCNYYKDPSTGTCTGGLSCGYFGEPRCITDEPTGGWKLTAEPEDVQKVALALHEITWEFDIGGWQPDEWFIDKAKELLKVLEEIEKEEDEEIAS
jgi:hypothetical protein